MVSSIGQTNISSSQFTIIPGELFRTLMRWRNSWKDARLIFGHRSAASNEGLDGPTEGKAEDEADHRRADG